MKRLLVLFAIYVSYGIALVLCFATSASAHCSSWNVKVTNDTTRQVQFYDIPVDNKEYRFDSFNKSRYCIAKASKNVNTISTLAVWCKQNGIGFMTAANVDSLLLGFSGDDLSNKIMVEGTCNK